MKKVMKIVLVLSAIILALGIAVFFYISVCSTKPLPKSRTTLDTRGERLRCFEFDEMDGI